jgi:hypothetical protein
MRISLTAESHYHSCDVVASDFDNVIRPDHHLPRLHASNEEL